MKTRIVLLLTLVLFASGCMSGDSGPDESFQGLLNLSESSGFEVSYSVSGPPIEDETNLTYYSDQHRDRFEAIKDTPGGTVIAESYRLENRTVSCYTSPSPEGGSTRCTVGSSDGIYTFLNPKRWEIQDVNSTGTGKVLGRSCETFSTRFMVQGQGLDPGATLEADICLDSEKGFVSGMNVSSDEKQLARFKALNYSEEPKSKSVELPRAVGIAGHCTDSYDVELTPLEEVDEAVLSVNGENRTVSLPERFETEFYSIPQNQLDVGDNSITVYTDQGSSTRYCYRRPN